MSSKGLKHVAAPRLPPLIMSPVEQDYSNLLAVIKTGEVARYNSQLQSPGIHEVEGEPADASTTRLDNTGTIQTRPPFVAKTFDTALKNNVDFFNSAIFIISYFFPKS